MREHGQLEPLRRACVHLGVEREEAFCQSWLLWPAAGTCRLRAANPGDEVIIVYNTRVPESKGVADYYAQRRHVPASQIFGFPLSTNEDMSRAEFRDALQKPLAEKLKKQKLWQIGPTIVPATTNHPGRVEWKPSESRIRYAVLCYGVPLRIAKDPHPEGGGHGEPAAGNAPRRGGGGQRTGLAAADRGKAAAGRAVAEPGLYHDQRGDASSDQRRAAGDAAGRPHAGHRARPGGQGARRPKRTACGGAPTSTCATSPSPATSWATTGFAARRKSAGAWALKRWWTRIPAPSRPAFP